MKGPSWVMVLFLLLGLGSIAGCFGSNREKPPTEEEKSKVDDDMRKAIEKNKSS